MLATGAKLCWLQELSYANNAKSLPNIAKLVPKFGQNEFRVVLQSADTWYTVAI